MNNMKTVIGIHYSMSLRIQVRNSRRTRDKVRRHGITFNGCKNKIITQIVFIYSYSL